MKHVLIPAIILALSLIAHSDETESESLTRQVAAVDPAKLPQSVPSLTLRDLETKWDTLRGKVVKIKFVQRYGGFSDSETEWMSVSLYDGKEMRSAYVPKEGRDYVRKVDDSDKSDARLHTKTFVLYALVCEGGKLALLGKEVRRSSMTAPPKFVW
jgi:hypothetical protein